jgi:hypothetical protein
VTDDEEWYRNEGMRRRWKLIKCLFFGNFPLIKFLKNTCHPTAKKSLLIFYKEDMVLSAAPNATYPIPESAV